MSAQSGQKRARMGRLAIRMARLRIGRNPDVAFGRPTTSGVPVAVLAERFAAGEEVDEIAADYDLHAEQVDNAIRFVLLYPKCDLPRFWGNR